MPSVDKTCIEVQQVMQKVQQETTHLADVHRRLQLDGNSI